MFIPTSSQPWQKGKLWLSGYEGVDQKASPQFEPLAVAK